MKIAHMKNRAPGVVIVELVAALTLIALLIGLTTTAISRYAHVKDRYTWRQAAMLAAEAQLKRHQLGAALDSLPPAGTLDTRISLSSAVLPGGGQWEHFDLVTVTATVKFKSDKPLQEKVSCFLPKGAVK